MSGSCTIHRAYLPHVYRQVSDFESIFTMNYRFATDTKQWPIISVWVVESRGCGM